MGKLLENSAESSHTLQDILQFLESSGTLEHRKSIARMGIPEEGAFGVSLAIVRKLANQIGPNQQMALKLWECGKHEARLLTVLIAEPDKTDIEQINQWLNNVASWDLCDLLCKTIIAKHADVHQHLSEWAANENEFIRRAAFATIANICIHRNEIDEELIKKFLHLIDCYAFDSRTYVKKSLGWALREIGKRDVHCHELALAEAIELMESPSREKRWVGKTAMRELENLVSIPERKRLISRKSKMGARRTY